MSLKISRILHAGYLFECENVQIVFDPIFENPFSHNCYAFPNVSFNLEQIKNLKLDAVFISHFHDDHCSLESLNLLDRKTPIYIYCIFEELLELVKKLGFTNVQSIEINKPIQIGSFEVIPYRTVDEDVDSIFQIKAAGFNVLNIVDSWISPETLKQLSQEAPWDMILWPFQMMREIEVLTPSRAPKVTKELPAEWMEQIQILSPKYIVPSSCQFIHESWSWYNHALFPISYQDFNQQIKLILPKTQIVRMNPSTSVILNKEVIEEAASLEWVQPIGDQNVDYQYDESIKPPATSEISKYFPALTAKESAVVFSYCKHSLIEKYNKIGSSSEIYFNKSRIWKLIIYDHNGLSTNFYYQLQNEEIKLLSDYNQSPEWVTEVSINKLYRALILGEALTSMYMRINDVIFEPDIEKEIGEVDVLEDPLVRCLFNGLRFAYQKTQLRRLLFPNDHY